MRAYETTLFRVLAFCAACFVTLSIHWPLMGDSAQIHYICFLMDHGMAPYRVTGDMNMPGALALEWAVMHTLGPGALAWRCFDLTLALAAAASMAVIAGKEHRFAGIGAGLLLLLLHGADGLNDTGERDLSMAVFLLLGYSFLFRCLRLLRTGSSGEQVHLLPSAFLFGISVSVAASIKPTVLPLVLALFAVLAVSLKTRFRKAVRSPVTLAGVGFALPQAAILTFLLQQQALAAFLHGLTKSVPYYAGLQHRSVGYLLPHSVAPLLPVVCLWALGPVFVRRVSLERLLMLLGVLFGLASYLVQAKGFPYYRYPLLAFLLPLMAVDCRAALAGFRHPNWAAKVPAALAASAMLYAVIVLGPVSAWKAAHFRWQDRQFITSLKSDLIAVGARDGEVQCIDSISGCGNALLELRLVQTTGLLSDSSCSAPRRHRLFGKPAPVFRPVW